MNLLLCTLFLIAQPDAPDLTGIYEVQGIQISGEKRVPYSSMAILKKIPETDKYVAQWTGGIGNNITGIGHLTNGKLTLAWKSGELLGVTEYKVGEKGTLRGQWYTNKGIDVWHTETLTYKLPWPEPKIELPIIFQDQEVPVKYSVMAEELYHVELYKDRVTFSSENWYGFGKLIDGKYRVQWNMYDDATVCFSYYERTGDHLHGWYWWASNPEEDHEDIYEKR